MAYRRRRICFKEGLFVLVIIISIFIDIRLAIDTTTTSSTGTSNSITETQNQSMLSTKSSISSATIKTTAATSILTGKASLENIVSKHPMRESVVIPSSNSEREAQEIYDKALKQFDSYGVSTRKICSVWEQHGCQCSGTIDELILSCRAIALNETPTDLPENLIKL